MKHVFALLVLIGLAFWKTIPEGEAEAAQEQEPKILAFDGFDGKLGLDWKILNPDPSHYSLSKNPGMLTITTQEGAFARSSANYKNLFVISCPAGASAAFQITARVSSFMPEASWNQAGLIFYNDDNNYLKWDYEISTGSPATFTVAWEKAGDFASGSYEAPPGVRDVWLKVLKRGNRYTVATSSDGTLFFPRGTFIWSDGSVSRVGLFAKNGPGSRAPELDALFDFFEMRSAPREINAESPKAPAKVDREQAVVTEADGRVLAFDHFDGEMGLGWEILRPAPSHYSLTKQAGTLTITTQEGALWQSRNDYENLFLIKCPADEGGNIEVTTCISSFKPVADWNQAGLICYNDDDNYLKFVFGGNNDRRLFAIGLETAGNFASAAFPVSEKPMKPLVRLLSDPFGLAQKPRKVWLRITKRGDRYTFATSLDGKTFVSRTCPLWDANGRPQNEFIWDSGAVKRIGLVAKNGPSATAPEVDVSFDFFEVRALPIKPR